MTSPAAVDPTPVDITNWTTPRARVGALTRSRPADDPDLLDARRDLLAARLADHIARTLDAAPSLTATQRDRLAALLRGGGPDAT